MDKEKKIKELLSKIISEYTRAEQTGRGRTSWKSVSMRQKLLAQLALRLLDGEDVLCLDNRKKP